MWMVLALAFLPMLASAQQQREPSAFAKQLWYGGNVVLGFSSGFDYSLFQFGVSPMVGYKITPMLSLGPRASLIYSNVGVRFGGGGDVQRVNTLSWAMGAFARVRFARAFFGQVEYVFESQPFLDSNLEVYRQNRPNAYIGVGYTTSQGSGWGTEILVTYNLTLPGNTLQSPFDYRIGFTYNF
jgi:hypothetical protein